MRSAFSNSDDDVDEKEFMGACLDAVRVGCGLSSSCIRSPVTFCASCRGGDVLGGVLFTDER